MGALELVVVLLLEDLSRPHSPGAVLRVMVAIGGHQGVLGCGGIWSIGDATAAGADAILGQPCSLLWEELGKSSIPDTQSPAQGAVIPHGSRGSTLRPLEERVEVTDRASRGC